MKRSNRVFLSGIGPKLTRREKLFWELEEARDPLGCLRGTNIGKQIEQRMKEEQRKQRKKKR